MNVGKIFSKIFRLGRYAFGELRPRGVVLSDFKRLGVFLDKESARHLTFYPQEYYEQVRRIVGLIRERREIEELFVGPFEEVSSLRLDKLPISFFLGLVKDSRLDLRKIRERCNEFVKMGQLSNSSSVSSSFEVSPKVPVSVDIGSLLDVIAQEIEFFEKIRSNPEATVDKVFHALDHGKKRLGFLNVVVYYPLGDGRWVVERRERDWSNGESKYDPRKGGSVPTTTLKSVIEGKKTIYDVDITDLSTFEREGLEYDIKSVENDLRNSRGPGRMLFVKLKVGEEVVGVVQIHNRVRLEEKIEPPPLLPDDPRSADRIKTALQLYFDEVSHTIATVKNRERIVPEDGVNLHLSKSRAKPFSPVQYSAGSEILRFGRFVIEYNGDPAKDYARIWPNVLRDYNEVVRDVLGALLPEDEMRDHCLYVSHSFTVRCDGKVVGFASAEEISDYIDSRGKRKTMVYYAGIMIMRNFRGGGTAYLTYNILRKVFKGLGLFRLLFGKTPVVFRTQDRRIFGLAVKYGSAKSNFSEFTEEEWNAIRFVAERYGWTFEEDTNICRNVYNRRLVDDEKHLLPGLSEKDAAVFVGFANGWSVLKLLWDIAVSRYFRRKK